MVTKRLMLHLGTLSFIFLVVKAQKKMPVSAYTSEYTSARSQTQFYPRWEKVVSTSFEKISARNAFASTIFHGSIYVVGGSIDAIKTQSLYLTSKQNDVWMTDNGQYWTLIRPLTYPSYDETGVEPEYWRARFGHTLVNFVLYGIETLVLTGGFAPTPTNDVWFSEDGVQWNSTTVCVHHRLDSKCVGGAPWSERGWHASAVFNGRILIMGGSPLTNDVWWTDDMVEWHQAARPLWVPRCGHAVVVAPYTRQGVGKKIEEVDVLFLFGGWNGEPLGDVWFTEAVDGNWNEAWALATPVAPWSARAWIGAGVMFPGPGKGVFARPRIVITGGGAVGGGVERMFGSDDTWSSIDGINWFPGSSAVTGISSAEWCLASVRGENLCRGKWGHGMEPVPASYQRYEMVYDKLQLQWVPLAFAGANRFTEENALLLFGGSTSDSLINDVFKSKEGLYCEWNGLMCANHGECIPGPLCKRADFLVREVGAPPLDYDVVRDQYDCVEYVRGCLCDPGYTGDWCQLFDESFAAAAPPSLIRAGTVVRAALVTSLAVLLLLVIAGA